jgi:hypothetical protein
MQNQDDSTTSSLLSDASKRLQRALKHVNISEDAIARLQYPTTSQCNLFNLKGLEINVKINRDQVSN